MKGNLPAEKLSAHRSVLLQELKYKMPQRWMGSLKTDTHTDIKFLLVVCYTSGKSCI